MNALDTAVAHPLEALLFGAPSGEPPSRFAAAMILVMLDAGEGISDLIFSPGRPPQVEQHGQLTPVRIGEVPVLQPEHTARVARELIASKTEVEYRQKSYGPDGVAFRIDLQFMILAHRLSGRSVG